MSDVSNSIRLNDYMSSTLRVINSTMELTIGIMERLNMGLLTLGMGGGLNGMNGELSAVMARIQVLEAMITSIGTGAGPGSEVLTRLNQQAMESQARIAQLEAQLLLLGNGGAGAGGAEMARLNQALLEAQARIIQLDARLEALGSGGLGASAEILRLNQALLEAQARIAQLDARLDLLGNGGGSGAAGDIARLNNELAEARARIQLLENQLNGLNNGAGRVGNQFGGWAMRLTGVFSGLQMIQMVAMSLSRVLNFTDQFTNANARLGLINDGLQTQQALQEDILKVSNDTGSSYKATADLVAKIGMTGAMDSTKSSVELAEKVNKLLAIGGGGTAQNEAALLQFSQSLASGRMQGDEFRSLKENAPALMNTISQGIGIDAGGLRQMATDGKLTTEVIIGALEKMGTTIDEQFDRMPRTFGFNMQVMKNIMGVWLADMAKAGSALGNLNQMFTDFATWLGSADGSQFLDSIGVGLNFIVLILTTLMSVAGMVLPSINAVFSGIGWGIESVITAISFFANLIWSVLPAIIALLVGYNAIWLIIDGGMILHNTIATIVAAKTWLITAAQTAWRAITMGTVSALFLLNFALITNPIGFLVGMVMVAVGIFAAWQIKTNGLRQTFSDVFGAIVDIVEGGVNFIIEGINGIIGAFNSVGGVLAKIFGFDYGEGLHEIDFRADYQGFKDTGQDFIENYTFDDLKADIGIGMNDIPTAPEAPSMPGMALNDIGTVDKVGKVGKIDSDVNIADEDMKMLMDLAIQNRVNQINLTVNTAAPIINQSNTVNNGQDLVGVVDTITKGIKEARQVTVAQDY